MNPKFFLWLFTWSVAIHAGAVSPPDLSGEVHEIFHKDANLSLCDVFWPTTLMQDQDEDIQPVLPITQQWNLLVPPGIDPNQVYVYDILVSGGYVYIAGAFWNANYPEGVVRWDGCTWDFLEGIHGAVECMVMQGGNLIAGGDFTNAGGDPQADNLASWDGNAWHSIGTSVNLPVHTLVDSPQGLVVGGDFFNAGGIDEADYIGLWNGNSWSALGSGLNGGVYSLAQYGSTLYVGGKFTDAGGNNDADRIAQWNGTSWLPLGTGMNGPVYTMVTYGADLYAGGQFTAAGGNNTAYGVAKWSNNTWLDLGTIPTDFYAVPTLQINDQYLYAGFTVFEPGSGNPQLLRYDLNDNIWEEDPIGCPAWETISAIQVIEDEVWVGSSGFFDGDYGWSGCLYQWGEPTPIITISGVPASICQDALPIPLPTNQSGYTGNWSGQGVSNNIFDPAGLYSYVLLTFTPDPGQCVEPVFFETEVYLNETFLTVPPTICQISPPIALGPYQGGLEGNWSGPGVVNNFFDPNGLLGFYTLMFTPNTGQCYSIGYANLQVQMAIIPNLFGIPETICENASPIALPVVQSGVSGSWSGPGVTNEIFDPDGLNGGITLNFTPNPGICATENSLTITVNPEITINVEGIPDSLCQTASPIPLPNNQSGIQGNWTGPGVNNNSFNPANQNGNVALTFTPNSGQCADSILFSIAIYLNVPVLSGLPDSVCESDPAFPLPTLQSGFIGSWFGEGVSNNIFNPNGLQGNIELTFTPDAGQCAEPVIHLIYINPLFSPVITGVPFSICSFSDPIWLPEIQEGIIGEWSGPGVSNDTFYPVNLNGNILLIFTPISKSCVTSSFAIISVQDEFIPELSGIPVLLCENAPPILLPEIQQNISGIWSGPGVSGNLFDPAGLQDSVLLIFTPDTVECALNGTWTIAIDTPSTAEIMDLPTAVCESDLPLPLPVWQSGILGQWMGSGVIQDTFNPFGLTGLVELTFVPNDNQCSLAATTDILVNEHVHPALADLPDSLCQNDQPIELPSVQDNVPGVWTGIGIENNFFNPDSLQGLQTLSFVASNGACKDTSSTQIFIYVVPFVTHLEIICDSVGNTFQVSFDIAGGDPTSYTVDNVWLGSASFTSGAMPNTQSYYSFLLDDANSCAAVSVTGFNTCLCSTHAGSMNLTDSPIKICLGPKFMVTNNEDAHLDQDDVLDFVLHDNAGSTLGQVYAINGQGVFQFIPGMIPGQTYFISAVAGNSNESGMVNLQDPCLSVAPGVPVIFEVCDPAEEQTAPALPDFEIPFAGPGDEALKKPTETAFIEAEIITDFRREADDIEIKYPGTKICAVNIYDMGGRTVFSQAGLQENSLSTFRHHLKAEHNWSTGFYLEVMEIKTIDERIFYLHNILCIVNR